MNPRPWTFHAPSMHWFGLFPRVTCSPNVVSSLTKVLRVLSGVSLKTVLQQFDIWLLLFSCSKTRDPDSREAREWHAPVCGSRIPGAHHRLVLLSRNGAEVRGLFLLPISMQKGRTAVQLSFNYLFRLSFPSPPSKALFQGFYISVHVTF